MNGFDHRIESVLISDDIDEICDHELKSNGIHVKVETKLTAEKLKETIKNFDALIVRSATKVTKDVIEAGKRLKLIGRAGTGVDNIDLEAATKAGVIVMNTPMGNSCSAAELTCAMIMCLPRRITLADQTMKQESWERKKFMGSEVFGKTLAIIGLGRIGREVAFRMQAFGMRVIGYDPIINAEESDKFNIKWTPLDKIWGEADYITVHVPLSADTENLINAATFDRCKKGVFVINCARGGVINETDLLNAIKANKCAGAALDVYTEEPPKNYALMKHPNVIATPHLGASTQEAQNRVAREIADQILAYSKGDRLLGAVNGHDVVATFDKTTKEISNCIILGSKLFRGLSKDVPLENIQIKIPASICKSKENTLKAAFAIGYFQEKSTEKINFVNAQLLIGSSSLRVMVDYDDQSSSNAVKIQGKAGKNELSITVCPSAIGPVLTAVCGLAIGNCVVLMGKIAIYKIDETDLSSFLTKLAAKCLSMCRTSAFESAHLIVAGFDGKTNQALAKMDKFEPMCFINFSSD